MKIVSIWYYTTVCIHCKCCRGKNYCAESKKIFEHCPVISTDYGTFVLGAGIGGGGCVTLMILKFGNKLFSQSNGFVPYYVNEKLLRALLK